VRRRLSFTALMLLAACGAKPSSTVPAPIFDGIYRFSERPQQLTQPIEGTITILRDTIMVDAQPGPCRYEDRLSWGGTSIVYRCAEMTLSFDRSNPLRNARFRTTVTVDERRTVCVRYEVNRQGQRVCAQQETQIVQREVPISGMLRPTRVSGSDQPS
jgi:hypothetical protein